MKMSRNHMQRVLTFFRLGILGSNASNTFDMRALLGAIFFSFSQKFIKHSDNLARVSFGLANNHLAFLLASCAKIGHRAANELVSYLAIWLCLVIEVMAINVFTSVQLNCVSLQCPYEI